MRLCRFLLFVGGSPTTPILVVRASVTALLVLAGIFVMRFSFYMMHMTVGISF